MSLISNCLLLSVIIVLLLFDIVLSQQYIQDTLTSQDDKRVMNLRAIVHDDLQKSTSSPPSSSDSQSHLYKSIPVSLYHQEKQDHLLYKLFLFKNVYETNELTLCEYHIKYSINDNENKGHILSMKVLNFKDNQVSINDRRYIYIFTAIEQYFKKHFHFTFLISTIYPFYLEDLSQYIYIVQVKLLNNFGSCYYFVNQSATGVFTIISYTLVN